MSGFRRYGRKPLKCAIRISHDGRDDIFAETRDISESGVFIRSADLLDRMTVGETVEAQLYSEQDDVSNTQLKVVRLTREGVGLAFE